MDIRALSDEDLALYVRSAHPDSYIEVVRRFEPELLGYMRLILGNELAAHAVIQDAFVKGYQNLHGFNESAKFKSWVFQLAHDEAMAYLTKNKSTLDLGTRESLSDELESVEGTLDESVANSTTRAHLKTRARFIPIIYRAPLILHILHGFSFEEIGDILMLPTRTVESRFLHGQHLLKQSDGNR